MPKAKRADLSEYFAKQDGFGPYEVTLDFFVDINDDSNPDPLDRAVVGIYDDGDKTFYFGVATIDYRTREASEPGTEVRWQMKEYFKMTNESRDVQALIFPPSNPKSLPVIRVPGDQELPEKPTANE